ncbi:MAG: tail fiber domain-containing protein [Chitinophagia bacterium]|nr:tail fiber domain-containing protein [Chitinophagia bacterium]
MTILPNGDVGIGTNSTSYKLHVNGTAAGTSWVNSSDMRLKNIAETYSSVDKINTILYEWKDGRDDRVHIGYGAQDVEKILPDAVYTDSEGMKAVNYDEVHTYKIMQLELVFKELQRQNEELQKLISRKRRIRH